jgi:lipoprotein-anchoring transpeptidase ErfK/SrfK
VLLPHYDCWAQYAFRIKGGVLFHSVLFQQAKESTLLEGSVKKVGRKASHGCVRVSVEDAKWIFENCAAGTTVIVE